MTNVIRRIRCKDRFQFYIVQVRKKWCNRRVDNTYTHISLPAMTWFRNRLGNIFSRRSKFPQPVRPPDLSSLDYFILGYATQSAFKAKSVTVNSLKQVVSEMISFIYLDIQLLHESEMSKNELTAVFSSKGVILSTCYKRNKN